MSDQRKFLDPHVLARVQGLELKARMIVEGYVSGQHRSPYHGFSVEFAEHREYVPGDDLRYIDWKLYGKRDRYYLKQYEEETNFHCYLLLDTSESMSYKSSKAAVSKLEYAQYLAASLAYMVLRQRDAVGLATYDREVRHFIRASSQPSHLKQLCHVMEQSLPQGETGLGPIFHDLAERVKKRGLIIILSDLFDDIEPLLLGLKHFHHRRHDVTVMQIVDPAEQDFPFDEPTLFRGLEGLPQQMTEPRSLRRAYQAEFESFLTGLRGGLRQMHIEHVFLRTDMPLDVALSRFVQHRMGAAHSS